MEFSTGAPPSCISTRSVGNRKEYSYDETSQKSNMPLTSQMGSTTEKKANPYIVDSSHQPHMIDTCLYEIPEVTPAPAVKNQKGAKKPMMAPQHVQLADSVPKPSSDGVYMALNPASLQQSQGEQQYMALSTAPRHGAAKMEEPQYVNSQKALSTATRHKAAKMEEPQYVNSQKALENRWMPKDTRKV